MGYFILALFILLVAGSVANHYFNNNDKDDTGNN